MSYPEVGIVLTISMVVISGLATAMLAYLVANPLTQAEESERNLFRMRYRSKKLGDALWKRERTQ